MPYLDAVLPSGSHLPVALLEPLRRCALRAQCVALKAALHDCLLTPRHVKLLAGDVQSMRMWAETLDIADEPCLMQLEQLSDFLGSGERMREIFVEDRVRNRWSLLSNLHLSDSDNSEPPMSPKGGGGGGGRDDWRAWRMPRADLVQWLSRMREEGKSLFGGAKMDKNAEDVCKQMSSNKK